MASAARLGRAGIPVTFVEDEVDHGQDRAETPGQLGAGRHAERDASHLDLGLSPGQPAFHRLGRDEEGPRDLLGGQAAHGAQRQCDLSLGGQGRVAAHEDELEPLVRDHRGLRGVWGVEVRRQQPELGGQDAVPAQPVDGAVAGRGDQPGGRVGGHPVRRPAARRDRERLRGGVLGEVEIAEVTDQRGQQPAPLVAEDLFDQGCSPRLVQDWPVTTGRISTEPPRRTAGIRAAISVARSRSSASSR